MGEKRFKPQREAVEEQWKQIETRIFTDYELEEFDIKLEKYNRLMHINDLERFYIDMHAANRSYDRSTLIYIQDLKAPGHLLKEKVDNKIQQWSDWRKRHGHTVRRMLELDKSAAAHGVTHHDDFGAFDVK